MYLGSFLCIQYIDKTAKTMYTKCLNKYLKGVPPSILTRIGTKLYTETSEKPRRMRVITQITMSPLKYLRNNCIMIAELFSQILQIHLFSTSIHFLLLQTKRYDDPSYLSALNQLFLKLNLLRKIELLQN